MFQMFRQNSRARARVFFMRVSRVHSVFLPSPFFYFLCALKNMWNIWNIWNKSSKGGLFRRF